MRLRCLLSYYHIITHRLMILIYQIKDLVMMYENESCIILNYI